MHVVLISPIPPPVGGIARWTENVLAYAKDQSGVEILHVDSSVRTRAVHDLSLPSRVKSGVRQWIGLRSRLRAVLNTGQPDVVHLTTSGSLGTLRDLSLLRHCRRRGVPVVYQLRFGRLPEVLASKGWEGSMMRCALRSASVVLVLDEASRRAAASTLRGLRVTVVPNPVDPCPPNPEPALPPGLRPGRFLLFAGHMKESKGVSDLVRAWSAVQADGWRLVLAGAVDGEYPDSLVRELAIEDSVLVLGEVPKPRIARLMMDCGVFVFPSHTEGFPNAVLEAMALGCAIIATPVGAVPEMLLDGAGVLVPTHEPEALAAAIRACINDVKARRSAGERAALRSREYAMGSVFASYRRAWLGAAGLTGDGSVVSGSNE